MITKVANNLLRAGVDSFTSGDRFTDVARRNNVTLANLIVLAVVLVVILLAGKWLWNNVACKLVNVLKPVPTVWHLLGFIVLLDLISPSCAC